jgi:hypothetical protein
LELLPGGIIYGREQSPGKTGSKLDMRMECNEVDVFRERERETYQ